ncbi:SBBP repeat beta-propeller lipoprotein, LipL53 family [Leptospira alstonii]|uniref:Beta-propeller repeat protein n=1 Tax=Leptospira alstonii serovar Sichuan str. 79601 TaxID=1218565 RepID=M6CN04_9LEPT|nr:SBBP repeat-containing protein [Leptospira alstonii]EMJ93119.1 beta-propeller repeat protein [Leptospira alstonii serovar Sichuan str. 79601]
MNRFSILVFILLSACAPARIFNVADPGTGDFWIQFLLRGSADHDPSLHDTFREDSPHSLELDWTLAIGSPNSMVNGQDLVVDQNGFIYVLAGTDGGIYIPQAIGTEDIIVGKYDSQRNEIWTQQLGAANARLESVGLTVDSNGNVYVTGNTYDDGFLIRPVASSLDMFIIKFNADGTRGWTAQTGAIGPDFLTNPRGICVDTFGNTYVVGESNGPFGGPEVGGDNGFIVKFDSNGNQVWARQLSIRNALIQPKAVAFDGFSGDIYMVGTSARVNFETYTAAGIGLSDLFILKYDGDNGNRSFFAQLGFPLKNVEGNFITVDPMGNVFVGGQSNADFGSGADGTANLGTLVKYNSLGVRQWIRQFGPKRGLQIKTGINKLTTDVHGNVYSTGITNANILDENKAALSQNEVFLTKHDPFGRIEWARQFGTPVVGIIWPAGIGVDLKGNLYFAGNTDRGLDWLPRVGMVDLFISKYK